MVKRIIISLAISMLAFFGNMGCFLTTGHQNARMLDRGEVQIIPDIGGAYDAGAIESDFYLSTGAQVGLGISERFNLGIRAAYYSSLTDKDRNGPFIGLIPKIGLKKDKMALAFPAYFYYTGGYPGGQFDARFIYSHFFTENADLTITPLVSLTVSGYAAFGIGTNVSCGIPLGNLPVTIRPEVGIMTLATDDWLPVVSYGIGCDIRPVKR